MQFVFLVGGLGTRLGEKTKRTPKPLLAMCERPFLDYLLDWAKLCGASKILLLCGYKADQVFEFAKSRTSAQLPIATLSEEKQMGTGGALLHALKALDDQFILSNGDSWHAFDTKQLNPVLSKKPEASIAMALKTVPSGRKAGCVELDNNGFVTSFKERGDHSESLINSGVYLIKKDGISDFAPNEAVFSLEGDLFPKAAQAKKIVGFINDGYFVDIGTHDTFQFAEDTFKPAFLRFKETMRKTRKDTV